MTIPEILKAFADPYAPFPLEALREAVAQRTAITPCLLQRLRDIAADPAEFISGDSNEHIFAMYLLAEFREPAAFPVVMDLLTSAGPRIEELMGDELSDGLQRVLASICGDDPERLRAVAEDPHIHPDIRSISIDALLVLGFEEVVPRDWILGCLRGWIQGADGEGKPSTLRIDAVMAASTFEARELLPDIDVALREGLAIPFVDDVDTLEELMDSPPWDYADQLCFVRCAIDELQSLESLIDPPLGERVGLPDWTPSEAPAPSVPWVVPTTPGRNDPCSCGSGKKFKKCCG
jgi:hypothetical protein